LYAVSEVDNFNGTYSGSVQAYRILREDGGRNLSLQFLNEVSSQGAYPCHLAFSSPGSELLVSNYGSGTLASVSIAADGSLGSVVQIIDHDASAGAHVHEAIVTAPRSALVADLGLDRVFQYSYSPSSKQFSPPHIEDIPSYVQFPEGSGPRHAVVFPTGGVALVLSELASTLSCLSYDAEIGFLKGEVLAVSSTLRDGDSSVDMAAAEIQLSSNGKFVYVSNRDISSPNQNRSSIAVFSLTISGTSCALTPIQHISTMGIHPRHFTLVHDRSRLIVANKDSSNVVSFKVDGQTGLIDPEGTQTVNESMQYPTQILIIP
jgi:6-phosphogluconolactonase